MNHIVVRCAARNLLVLLFGLTIELAWAGGSGLNVIVVVNQNSTNSVQLGNDYCEQRGVPPQNVYRMTGWTGGTINWSVSDFESKLRDPLLAMIAARNLSNQISFVLLSMDIPYRVTDNSGVNSTTSALFYGFKADVPPPDPSLPISCSLPDSSSNSYCYSELPFTQAQPNTAVTNSFLAMMLTDTNLAGAERILASGVASDSSFPTQAVYLQKTIFWANNVRYLEFDNASFESRTRGNDSLIRIDGNSTSFTNVLGLSTGLATLSLPSGAFVSGALADSLTSFAGYLFEDSGQTPLLAFLDAGASGSYGTVVEPCNYLEKFPDPVDYFYQQRGFCLAEAYYQSLLNPYQGLFVGEPLSAPFAIRGAGDWSSLTNGSVLSGLAPLSFTFSSGAPTLPLDQVDLFVEGTFFQTLTNVPPATGNLLEVVLNGSTVDYQVPSGSTLTSTTAGLASALNAQTNITQVQAFPAGDRLQLQSLDLTNLGSNVSLSANVLAGTGSALTTQLTASRPTFLDTVATGYLGILINNTAASGDWLQVEVTKTNGVQVIVAATNTTAGSTLVTLAQNLVDQVNSSPDLQSADGCYAGDFFATDAQAQFYLYPRSAGWAAAQAQATLSASSNLTVFPASTAPLQDNVSDLRPRNHLYLNSGVATLPVNFTLDTTQLADGFHELAAVAYEGSSVRTQTRLTRTVVVQNTPLSANLTSLIAGTNVTLDTPLQFAVSANESNISRIELFSTGGSIGAASNQPNAAIAVPSGMLELGLHPFYALVSDTAGHQYRTQTVWIRLIPSFRLTISSSPPTLSWPTLVGQEYEILMTTNLSSSPQVVASITAANSVTEWPIPASSALTSFYQVRLR
jgi:uncharacterized protein (TIGR03790 family)